MPYSFGGNKARKAKKIFEEFDAGSYDCLVTYGSSSSNHCRVVSNLCAMRGVQCFIISPEETKDETFNRSLVSLFGAETSFYPVEGVSLAIKEKIRGLRGNGRNPLFIPGGGHGNTGTHTYVECYKEIKEYEKAEGIFFDYIFHASGTGTTQAGLICGQIINGDDRRIIGISIARSNPYGAAVVLESVWDYLLENDIKALGKVEDMLHFIDDYVCGGYGKANEEIKRTIRDMMIGCGVPLDMTYTGKAFWGMEKYLEARDVREKNVLFIHTGGAPLFFDDLRKHI